MPPLFIAMQDSEFIEKIKTLNIQFKGRERLRYGSNAPSRFVRGENGERDLVVLSDGLLEKQEIDYIVEANKEKEENRLKNKKPSETNQTIGALIHEAQKAPRGKRGETIDRILEGG